MSHMKNIWSESKKIFLEQGRGKFQVKGNKIKIKINLSSKDNIIQTSSIN